MRGTNAAIVFGTPSCCCYITLAVSFVGILFHSNCLAVVVFKLSAWQVGGVWIKQPPIFFLILLGAPKKNEIRCLRKEIWDAVSSTPPSPLIYWNFIKISLDPLFFLSQFSYRLLLRMLPRYCCLLRHCYCYRFRWYCLFNLALLLAFVVQLGIRL